MIGSAGVATLDWEAVEHAARRKAMQVAAAVLERFLNADHTDAQASRLPCSCGGQARYAGRMEKTFLCVLGPLRLERAYYHCRSCGHGFFPRDHALGLEDGSLSPAIVRMIGQAAKSVSFAESSELLHGLAGVRVSAKQVERTAETLGAQIAAEEKSLVEPDPDAAQSGTMYLSMDGTGAPMRRSEVEDRPGKQPDGSSKTREVKLACVFTAESRDKKGNPCKDDGSQTYSAAIESAANPDTDPNPSPFAARVLREVQRRGFDRASRQVVQGDGAEWIWNMTALYFPEAIEIVDLGHAKQHLGEVGKAIYGPNSERTRPWVEKRYDDLEAGRFDTLLEKLREHTDRSDVARKELNFFEKNRDRMRYPEFRAAGLTVGTGVIEAGCRSVVGQRLKQSGMFWTLQGANSILALRCSWMSGRFEGFWERRAERNRKKYESLMEASES